MAISRSSTDTEIVDENLSGPGRRLRDARIARNLDLEEVASRLHLHLNIIQRIEADDYENLPAPTFVRGYLRGYARMLDIAPDQIVGAYNSHEFDPPPLVRDISNTAEVRSTDISFRLATYLILTVVVILVAIWWQNQDSGIPRNTSPDAEVAGVVETPGAADELDSGLGMAPGVQAEVAASEDAVSDDSTTPVDALQEAPATGEDLRQATAVTDDSAPSDALVLMAHEGELVLTETADGLNDTGSETQTLAALENPESTEIETPSAPAQEPNILRITVGSETWLEVYDRDNNKLYYDLAKAGRVVDFSEDGQLSVLLGNTTDVMVELNGVKFDIGPYTNAGVARFSVPAATDSPTTDSSQADTEQQ